LGVWGGRGGGGGRVRVGLEHRLASPRRQGVAGAPEHPRRVDLRIRVVGAQTPGRGRGLSPAEDRSEREEEHLVRVRVKKGAWLG